MDVSQRSTPKNGSVVWGRPAPMLESHSGALIVVGPIPGD